ncbi:D-glycero-beta-D-manno-heptose-7-phosphate kinase [Taylorella equigenitalis]|uniref:D-glycero-beta-D-manno-heptose-7-phosphate kinase n=1 Tax=Taylorella equigenitalis TaxID=29575 RepID=UPI0004097BBE|nr:D-glycero-beta-D-manno-heptose-7-phosphate kinase [Taylorella equigenitalis]ASY30301.1 D-glycero-beta-D-manno-heptose-7-phosphate kinase [Taylorella equigenitalis]WEE00929.1 D-glycero-beta-D-manno-heptose-7-phosphate kinase [Taylorella equigenitalis]WEE02407.1 D-glycero-beta-D-manno-heptose-7-phosphate kinase [Taylorella equigenitalis]WFD78946.1 D-glycero-beta-D-manno-heptose-7-phosphate kinase [Taylorella equigenitalis]WFD80420.1 D-glycero-beta-D-manno-heptose-7-phosphate kinase [Taylorell
MSNNYPLEKIKKSRILVIGDLMVDRYWFGQVDRISPEAPVPVVHVKKNENRLGGAANVASNIVSLGAQATLMGVVGLDEPANILTNLCDEHNIKTNLVVDDKAETTIKMRVLGGQQQLLRIDFEKFPSDEIAKNLCEIALPLIQEHDLVVFSDYNKGALKFIREMISHATSLNIPVLVDPKGADYSRYSGASLITPNRKEMEQAVGLWNTEEELTQKAQEQRNKHKLGAILVTRSERGMTLFDDNGRRHQDAQAKEVFDVSGAGDTVLATLAVTHAAGLDLKDAIIWANKAGGIVVGKLGTSTVSAKEIMQ